MSDNEQPATLLDNDEDEDILREQPARCHWKQGIDTLATNTDDELQGIQVLSSSRVTKKQKSASTGTGKSVSHIHHPTG